MQIPKTAKEIAAEHLIGARIARTITILQPESHPEPVEGLVLEAGVRENGWFWFKMHNRLLQVADLSHIRVVCRGCGVLQPASSDTYSPDLCNSCWVDFHNP